MKSKAILIVLIMAIMGSASASYAGEEEEIPWTKVLAPVQKTITENASGGNVLEEVENED